MNFAHHYVEGFSNLIPIFHVTTGKKKLIGWSHDLYQLLIINHVTKTINDCPFKSWFILDFLQDKEETIEFKEIWVGDLGVCWDTGNGTISPFWIDKIFYRLYKINVMVWVDRVSTFRIPYPQYEFNTVKEFRYTINEIVFILIHRYFIFSKKECFKIKLRKSVVCYVLSTTRYYSTKEH